MRQIIIDFGQSFLPIRIYGYGLMLVLGFLIGIFLARHRARRFGENADTVTTLGLLALGAGVAGARIAYVIERWDTQFSGPGNSFWEIFNITSGGLIYYGGVLLAVLAVVTYLGIKRLPARRYLDIIAPSLMIGLAFGRMGCFLNGCCYGGEAKQGFPLAMSFPYASQPLLKLGSSPNIFGAANISPAYSHEFSSGRISVPADVPAWLTTGPIGAASLKNPRSLTPQEAEQATHLRSLPLLPSQLLEMAGAALIAGILLVYSRLRLREGQVFTLMLILYPPLRFLMEMIRGDNLHDLLALKLTHNQYSSMIMVAVGVAIWLGLHKLPASCGAFVLQRQATKHPKNRVATQ